MTFIESSRGFLDGKRDVNTLINRIGLKTLVSSLRTGVLLRSAGPGAKKDG